MTDEKRKYIFGKLQLIFLLIVMGYCLYQMGSYTLNSFVNRKLNNEMIEIYETSQIYADMIGIDSHDNLENLEENNVYEAQLTSIIENATGFKELKAINADIIGWIKINDTKIEFPVVKAQDNAFYLNHNIKKDSSKSGSIFMDYRNKENLQNRNTIIYGHNMKDGTMFEELMNYKNEDFFITHPFIDLITLKEETQWEIFSVYITDTNFNYIKTNFSSDEEYHEFLKELKNKSLYDTGVTITGEDIILTLSTCTYEFSDARFAVHAKLISRNPIF